MNTEQYVQTMAWLQTLTGLLEQMQVGYCFCSVFSHQIIADQNDCVLCNYEV